MDGTNWQDSAEFSGLLPDTEYTFYQRIKATNDANDSPASPVATIGTKKDTYGMTITLVIKEKATVTVPTASTLTYNGQDQTLVSGGTMQYALGENNTTAPESGWSATVPAGKNVGPYYVWYKAVGDSNHRDSDTACVTAEIKKADITPTVSISDWVYGATASTPSVVGNSGNGAVTYTYTTKNSTEFSADVPTAVGEYTMKTTVAATTNYNCGEATKDFKITKAAPAVSAPTAKTLTYNGQEQALVNAGSSAHGEMQYSTSQNGTYSTEVPAGKDAKAYTVWYKVVGDRNHSDSTPASVDVSIAQKEIGLKWSTACFTYNGQEQAPTATATDLVAADEGKVSVTVTRGQTNASDTAYTATASALTGESAANYALPTANTKTFTIAQKEVGLNWTYPRTTAQSFSSQYGIVFLTYSCYNVSVIRLIRQTK